MTTKFEPHELKNGKDIQDFYKWGVFYFNPEDTRVIVPKRINWMGWTLNFANRYSYLVLLGIVLVIAGIIIYTFMMEKNKNS